jgi:exonuclease III
MGDFNACNEAIDRNSNKIYPKQATLLNTFAQNCNISDAYRYINPNTIKFTYTFLDYNIKSRIDRFYVTNVNKNNIKKCEISEKNTFRS